MGLYSNIHAKRKRIKAGSKETMRKILVLKVHQQLRILNEQQKQRRKNNGTIKKLYS
jgi:hypothetical protein